MRANQFNLVKTRRFLPLFITQLLGAYNDNAYKSAFAILLTYKLVQDPHHAQMLISLAGGLFILPFLLFSAFSGQLADKFDRGYLVRWVKLIEIGVLLVALLGFYLSSIPVLMASIFLMGTHSTFYGPIKYSALPDLLVPDELLGGICMVEASTFIAILLGTIVGTLFGATIQGAMGVTLVSLALAFIGWFSSFFLLPLPIADSQLTIDWNFFKEIGRLVNYTYKNRVIYRIIMEISWFWFLGFIFLTQFPIYVKKVMNGNEQVATLFLILFSVGLAVGSVVCNTLLKGKVSQRIVPLGILGMSIFTFDLCWRASGITVPVHTLIGVQEFLSSVHGWRISMGLFLLAVFGGIMIVPLYALLQTESDFAYRSRIVSCNNIFNAIFMVAASLVLMALTAMGFSIVQIFFSMGLVNAVVAWYVWRQQTSRFITAKDKLL